MECISDAYNHFVRTKRRNITSAMCCADTAVVFSNFQIVPPVSVSPSVVVYSQTHLAVSVASTEVAT